MRLYQLSGAGVCCGGKVLNTVPQPKASVSKKQMASQITQTAVINQTIPKPPSASVKNQTTLEDLQQKLAALTALKTKKNSKRFVSL